MNALSYNEGFDKALYCTYHAAEYSNVCLALTYSSPVVYTYFNIYNTINATMTSLPHQRHTIYRLGEKSPKFGFNNSWDFKSRFLTVLHDKIN